MTGLAATVIDSRLGSKIARYYLNEMPVFSTSIRAGAQDKGWLDVDAAPGAAPNQGAFWCPFLFLSATAPNATTGALQLYTEYLITVECRGSKI